jgi:hypothetical protein
VSLGPAGELLRAIDAADDLIHNARPVPLTDQVRIKRSDVDDAVTRVRNAAAAENLEFDVEFGPALNRFTRIPSEAAAIPLTDQIRYDREQIYDALDELRARIPQAVKEARWEWKEAGGTVPPGTDEITLGED